MTNADKNAESAYAGRWVARIKGKIIAQAGTPQEARQIAAVGRHKEFPEIVYMPLNIENTLLETVIPLLTEDSSIYLVGGAVRDILIKRPTHDLDFVVQDNAIKTARGLANKLNADFFVLDAERDMGRIVIQTPNGSRDNLDFSAFRGADLDADLAARDFTINAIALNLSTREIYDPFNGAIDLQNKIIRACSPNSISDDPIRILRAVRQAAALGFKVQPETRQMMSVSVQLLPNISVERQRDELFKIMDGPQPATVLRALEFLDVFPHMLPESPALKGVEQPVPHVHDVWTHTLKVIEYLENILSAFLIGESHNLRTEALIKKLGRFSPKFISHFQSQLNADRSLRALLFFSALYHDVAKPQTKTVEGERIRFLGHDALGAQIALERASRFNLSNPELARIEIIIREHMRVHFHTNRLLKQKALPTRRGIYRFFRDTEAAGVDLVLLAMADLLATYDDTMTDEIWNACLDVANILLENWWDKPAESIAPPQLINGNDVIHIFKLTPGPIIGELLESVREGQAMGKVSNREEALAFGREWISKK